MAPKIVIEEIEPNNAEVAEVTKTTRETSTSSPIITHIPDNLTRDESRARFLAHKGSTSDDYNMQCVMIMTQYLDDSDKVRGRTAKAVIATRLLNFLIQNPTFLATHNRLANTVILKMKEIKTDTLIPDAVISEDFHKTVSDILFITTGEEAVKQEV